MTEALERVSAKEAGPGEIIAVAGIEEVTIGETLADPDQPTPLPVISVDEPSLSILIGINTSPLAGLEGKKLTARQILDDSTPSWSAMFRFGSTTSAAPTPGRSRGAASCSWSSCWR